jgi:inhibitor of KinA
MSPRPPPSTAPAGFAPRVQATGDAAVMLELSDTLDLEANALAGRVADRVRAAAPEGVTDVVPGIVTVVVHFEAADAQQAAARREAIGALLRESLVQCARPDPADARAPVEIPVCYEPGFAPDLDEVAAAIGLSAEEVVSRHVASAHRVLMMGFAPGFPYVGGLDARLSVPRRATPRARVEAGSVAIANGQTAVYPFATPGGWSLIGRTPLRLFDPSRERPSLVRAGDAIVFVPITAIEFERLAARADRR